MDGVQNNFAITESRCPHYGSFKILQRACSIVPKLLGYMTLIYVCLLQLLACRPAGLLARSLAYVLTCWFATDGVKLLKPFRSPQEKYAIPIVRHQASNTVMTAVSYHLISLGVDIEIEITL